MKQYRPRSPAELAARYRVRRIRVLERSLELSQAPLARNCVHHHQQGDSGFCMFGVGTADSEWSGELCEGAERAPFCPYFEPRFRPLEVLDKTVAILNDDAFLEEAYPDLAELRWALGMRGLDAGASWWLRFKERVRSGWVVLTRRAEVAEVAELESDLEGDVNSLRLRWDGVRPLLSSEELDPEAEAEEAP